MKKIPLTLVCMIVISSVLVACLGAYLKYEVLKPLDIFPEENIMSVPFKLLADHGAMYTLRAVAQEELLPPPTEPLVPPTQAPTEPPTVPPTEPPTEPPVIEVEESWFDDVLFIGDSRTVGMRDYARLGNAEYFCSVGMTLFNAENTWAGDKNFQSTTLENLLTERSYGKIYIILGINDCGYPHDTLIDSYEDLLELVREKQPDSVIILQSIMAVSKSKARSAWYFGMDNINAINERIAALADGGMIRYVDVNEWIANEDGYLPNDMTGDGCHLFADGYQAWAQWILDSAGDLRIP